MWIAAGCRARAAFTTWASRGWPASGISTLGRADFIRVPAPAARTITCRGGVAMGHHAGMEITQDSSGAHRHISGRRWIEAGSTPDRQRHGGAACEFVDRDAEAAGKSRADCRGRGQGAIIVDSLLGSAAVDGSEPSPSWPDGTLVAACWRTAGTALALQTSGHAALWNPAGYRRQQGAPRCRHM